MPCENGCPACPSLSRLVRDEGREGKRKKPVLAVTFLRSDASCSLHKPAPPDADWHLLQSALWDLSFIFYGSFSSLPLPLLDSGAGESLSRSGVKAGRWKFRLLMCLSGGVSSSVPPTKGRFVWPLCGLTLAGYRNLFCEGCERSCVMAREEVWGIFSLSP